MLMALTVPMVLPVQPDPLVPLALRANVVLGVAMVVPVRQEPRVLPDLGV